MRTLVCLIALAASGCAYNQKPVVDLSGVDSARYQQDVTYCQGFAESVDKGESARVAALNGAATWGSTGALYGALEDGFGGAGVGVLVGGLLGSVLGAAEGANMATEQQALVLRRCLSDKGYRVYDLQT
ncbi:hypothetical protein [Ferrimonas marina]|uniref:Glycine zipper family protein n=1 Tax=Ferrimonas marina TaxID=299255 RepID=A0A1M5ZKN9_9GAMM|nr:hypothetical protein [Ferrimonas marina]SHI24915.1 hypothetical protein SAMN02745129_0392 [Ferrimonas marina]